VSASQPCWSIHPVEPDNVVTMSLSDTEEALELLSLSPSCGAFSRPSEDDAPEPSSSSTVGSGLFEDWPKANDMAASVYVALTTEPSSSRSPMVNAPQKERKSHAKGSSTQKPRSQAVASQRPRHQKTKDIEPSRRKSKRTKRIAVGDTSAVPSLCGDSLSAADFDQSE
jgi:hypothetical protein